MTKIDIQLRKVNKVYNEGVCIPFLFYNDIFFYWNLNNNNKKLLTGIYGIMVTRLTNRFLDTDIYFCVLEQDTIRLASVY